MFKFIKYEWLRRWKFFLAGILVFVIANVDLLNRIINKEGPNLVSVILIVLLFALGAILIFDHMGRLYRALFSDEGIVELTLPLSGYQLLGAKLLAVVLECVAVIAIVGIVAYADIMYVSRVVPDWQLTPLTWEIFLVFLQVLGLVLGGYITFILMVYLSLALTKSFFASLKYGKLIAFGCFLLIAKSLEILNDLLDVSIHGPNVIVAATDWLVVAVLIGILFTGTAYLLDRKINL